MLEFLQTGKGIYILAAICLVSLAGKLAAGSFYKRLIKETGNMMLTKNKWLRELRQRAEDAFRLNQGVANTRVFVERQVCDARIGFLTPGGWNAFSGEMTALCFLAGGIAAFLSYWYRCDSYYIILYSSVGALTGIFNIMVDLGCGLEDKRQRLCVSIQDYLENSLWKRLGRDRLPDLEEEKSGLDAAQAGAAVIVAEEPVEAPGAQVVLVPDTRKALALLSAAFFENPAEGDISVIGVTGTKGKTTTAYMIRSILEAAGHKTGVIGTIGVLMGEELIQTDNTTPMSYDIQMYLRRMADAGCRYCVMEASSIGLKDLRVYGFPFSVGVFTNFSEDHIGGVEHKDMQEYMESKAKLFSLCKVGVVNADDPSLEGILQGHTCQVKTYGFEAPADLRGADCRHLNKPGFLGIAFEVSGEEDFTAEVDIPGRFNAYNALAAIGACHELGVPVEAMKQGLSTVKVKGRVEPVPVPGNYTLLLDYAHNGVGMENILTTLREYHPKRLICMFGAGGNRPKVRRYEMGEISGRLADISVLTADNSRFEDVNDIIADIKVGMAKTEGKYVEIPDRREAIRWCLENAQEGDIIVLAGKGHEDYQEIQGEKRPFDERVVIRELLEEMGTPQPQAAP